MKYISEGPLVRLSWREVGSASCAMVGFSISGAELSGSDTRVECLLV
jgi:hypothetical protein